MTRHRKHLVLAFSTSAVVALAALALAEPPTPRRHATLVGIKAYNHDALPDPEYTERDVEELQKLLEPTGYHVTLLTTAPGEVSWDDGYAFTAPVGQFAANAFGLFDMHGGGFTYPARRCYCASRGRDGPPTAPTPWAFASCSYGRLSATSPLVHGRASR
jgi:hypothetical protein